jgi:transposase
MTTLPNLKDLTPQQKDDLLLELLRRLNELEAAQEKDSHNSSKPPSSDGFKRQPKSLRQSTGSKPGGQPGHRGKTLKRVAHPDATVVHPVDLRCDVCGACLDPTQATLAPESRQVIDLPVLRYLVTEHRVQRLRCRCGKEHCGQFPARVSQPVQYGPGIRATAVYLTQYQQLPVLRTAQAMADLFGIALSAGTVQQSISEAAQLLKPASRALHQALRSAPVIHVDETSVHVGRGTYWLHSTSSTDLTWYGADAQRGKAALDQLGILPGYQGVVVHDGWRPYADYRCQHALCNAHHLRELIFIVESTGQAWAQQYIDLLRAAKAEADASVVHDNAALSRQRVAYYRRHAQALIEEGLQKNPRQERERKRTETRGRIRQSFAYNLLARLTRYREQVWRFISDLRVPFDNNQAERDLRMPKLKQKISGCWRTKAGLQAYCTIRSYLGSLRKQQRPMLDALTRCFAGALPSPLRG